MSQLKMSPDIEKFPPKGQNLSHIENQWYLYHLCLSSKSIYLDIYQRERDLLHGIDYAIVKAGQAVSV